MRCQWPGWTPGIVLMKLLLPVLSASGAWTPPALRASLDLHWTDNELADSTLQADRGGQLNLRLRQAVGPFSLEAGGSLDRHAEHEELDLGSHSVLAAMQLAPGKWDQLWANAGLFTQRYAEAYSLYDRERRFVTAGLRRSLWPRLKSRAQFQLAHTHFPTYPDSQQVDYRDLALSAGLNAALPWPLAVDAEAGLQERRYVDMQDEVATAWLWGTVRLSRPWGERLGLRVQGSRRWQLSQQAVELESLAANGLDPAELLYDGWQVEAGLQHLGRRWRSSLSADGLWADYVAEPGVSARQDQSMGLRAGVSRGMNLASGWTLGVNLELGRRWTHSSIDFYNAPNTWLQAGLSVELP